MRSHPPGAEPKLRIPEGRIRTIAVRVRFGGGVEIGRSLIHRRASRRSKFGRSLPRCSARVVRVWPKPRSSSRVPFVSEPTALAGSVFRGALRLFSRRPKTTFGRASQPGVRSASLRKSLGFSETCVSGPPRFSLRDNAKLRAIDESHKSQKRNLSTSRGLAVDKRDEGEKSASIALGEKAQT